MQDTFFLSKAQFYADRIRVDPRGLTKSDRGVAADPHGSGPLPKSVKVAFLTIRAGLVQQSDGLSYIDLSY